MNFIEIVESELDYSFVFSVQLIPKSVYIDFGKHLQSSFNKIELELTSIDNISEQIILDKPQALKLETNKELRSFKHLTAEFNSLLSILRLFNGFAQNSKHNTVEIISLKKVVENYSALFASHKISIKIDEGLNDFKYDKNHFATIIFMHSIFNILHNAIKHAKSCVEIQVRIINPATNEIELLIFDDGLNCQQNPLTIKKSSSGSNPLSLGWKKNWALGLQCSQALLGTIGGSISLVEHEGNNVGKYFAINIPGSVFESKIILTDIKINYHDILLQYFTKTSSHPSAISIDDISVLMLKYSTHSMKNLLNIIPRDLILKYPILEKLINKVSREVKNIYKHDIFSQEKCGPNAINHTQRYKNVMLNVSLKHSLGILLIDDNPICLMILEAMIQKKYLAKIFNIEEANIIIHSYNEPQQAVDYFTANQNNIDIVITDMNMTEQYNGFDIAKIVDSENIVTALCSGAVSNDSLIFSHVLEKPMPTDAIESFFKKFIIKPYSATFFQNELFGHPCDSSAWDSFKYTESDDVKFTKSGPGYGF